METAGDEIDARIDRRRSFDDLVDARVRAADDYDHAVRRIECERQFAQFERPRLVGNERDQMDARRDLAGLVDKVEVRARPRGAEAHDLGRRAVVIALLGRQRGVLPIERARHDAAVTYYAR